MQIGTFEFALIIGLSILLVIASVTDWRRREIDNWLNGAIALGAPLFWFATAKANGTLKTALPAGGMSTSPQKARTKRARRALC